MTTDNIHSNLTPSLPNTLVLYSPLLSPAHTIYYCFDPCIAHSITFLSLNPSHFYSTINCPVPLLLYYLCYCFCLLSIYATQYPLILYHSLFSPLIACPDLPATQLYITSLPQLQTLLLINLTLTSLLSISFDY